MLSIYGCKWFTAALDAFSEAVEVAIHYAVARCGLHELSTKPSSLNFQRRNVGSQISARHRQLRRRLHLPVVHGRDAFAPCWLSVLPRFRCQSAVVTLDQSALEHEARATGQPLQVGYVLEDQIRVSVDNDK